MVIELNPFHQGSFFFNVHNQIFNLHFHSGAGACLFSWAKDRETFMNGPYTFRVVSEEAKQEDPLVHLPGYFYFKLRAHWFFVEEGSLVFVGFWSRNLSPYLVQKKKEEEEKQIISFQNVALVGGLVILVSLLFLSS